MLEIWGASELAAKHERRLSELRWGVRNRGNSVVRRCRIGRVWAWEPVPFVSPAMKRRGRELTNVEKGRLR